MEIDRLKKKDIDKIFREGKDAKGDFFALKALRNNLGIFRFGSIISQKISKKASVRNKIRRRLREVVRIKKKNKGEGWDILFIALPGAEEREFKQIKEMVEKLFGKLKIDV